MRIENPTSTFVKIKKMKHLVILITLLISITSYCQVAIDISGITTWPELKNSFTNWQNGAFNSTINQSNQNDLGWGVYNPSNHNVYGDSIYVMLLPNGVYKQIYMEQLVNGQFTFHYANLDGTNKKSVVLDKDDFQGKNFGYFSFFTETENHSLEPISSDWDLVFMRYNRPSDGYGVAGVLSNKHVTVAESDGIDPTIVDPSTLTYSADINTIGYDWKQFGSNGFEVVQNRAYYLIDETGDTTEIIFKSFSGSSGGGVCKFTVNGNMKSITMGTGYVNRVFFELSSGVVHTSARNGWDLAFDGTNYGTAIRTNEEIGNKLWVYPLADTAIWNSVVSIEDQNSSIDFVTAFPNPIENQLSISFGSTKDETIFVQLFTSNGRLALENKKIVTSGISTIALDASYLPKGLYLLQLTDPKGNLLHREKVAKF